jgi:predicted dehydrogenase
MCADPDKARLEAVKDTFAGVEVTADYKNILKDPAIHAVCIAAPTNLHYSLTKESLESGKHVLCEKPLAMTPEQCRELKHLAQKKNKVLMVGHIFLFNAGINWLKNYIQSGELGKIHYAYSTRTNLGPFRYDVNALWDLAPHDISIFNYLFDSCPVHVSACGQKCLGESLEDISFATLEYADGVLANVHVSWLDPKKVRQITIVGDKKMIVWDDLDSAGPIKLYDKHVEKTKTFYKTYGEFQLLSQEGSTTIPKIASSEPLKTQAECFLNSIAKGSSPELSDAQKGLEVVQTLCAIQASMDQKGACVTIS